MRKYRGKNILVVMATAKFKAQKEKGRFLHRSIYNGHFNKSHSFSSHAQTTIKHFQPLPLEEPCPLALLKCLRDAGLFLLHHSPSISHAVFSCSVTWVLFIVIPYSLQCGRRHDSAHDISAAPSGFAACNMWST